MANALIPVFTGTISNASVQLCDARNLHTFMQVKRDFSNWIKGRIRKFGFEVDVDYLVAKSGENLNGRPTVDYHLTLDMAKELSMVENNEMGRQARRYFIECEKAQLQQPAALPTPDQPSADQIESIELHVRSAMQAAYMTTAQIQTSVFEAVMKDRDWKHQRWLVSFITDSRMGTPAVCEAIAQDKGLFSFQELPGVIADKGVLIATRELEQIANACVSRMASRVQSQGVPA